VVVLYDTDVVFSPLSVFVTLRSSARSSTFSIIHRLTLPCANTHINTQGEVQKSPLTALAVHSCAPIMAGETSTIDRCVDALVLSCFGALLCCRT
jgi:hypothetical protein